MNASEPPRPETPRLGELLRSLGLVTDAQLSHAVSQQRRFGGALGRWLILDGALSRRRLYQVLATQWGIPLVDLSVSPPAREALADVRWQDLASGEWIPWRRSGDHVTVATSVAPGKAMTARLRRVLGAASLDYVATTDWDVGQALQAAYRSQLRRQATDSLAEEQPEKSASRGLAGWQKALPVAIAAAIVAGVLLSPRVTVISLFALSNLLFAINVCFKTGMALIAPISSASRRHWNTLLTQARALMGVQTPPPVPEPELPIYTILIPVYHEQNVIAKILSNLADLEYPKSKLDVLVLLEEDDIETIAAAKRAQPPEYVRIVVVPEGTPRTKPRACNYGLTLARGSYVVIFDAEDRPDPGELRSALAEFRGAEVHREYHGGRALGCVQGALGYFNADYNVLTRMFAIEYAHWFKMMLPGMDAARVPIPLGGTSNHFRTEVLQRVGGWDPYNVTEDADLGLRLDAAGYRTGVIAETTWEEATSRIRPWITQRTRWIKGYMMTAAVNLRCPFRWMRANGFRGTLTMVGLVLGTPLAFLSYPLCAVMTVLTYVGLGMNHVGIPHWIVTLGWANMLWSNLAMILLSGIAAWQAYSWRIALFAVFNPVYWFLHSIAAWRALVQIMHSPFSWEKTPHGLSGDYQTDQKRPEADAPTGVPGDLASGRSRPA
ncbi:MAG: glycosyltransferase [Microbacteriaceae bacterium]|jgi:cellulose synthase/poly-beta-1,6-N-acetylglucosamine synthase-like glycosyltransferase|nr:glycosyltransferase [Microbacteriaceae bacterium]MCI1207222.1 glycosyltransferase [Microbacteriaceae bacterium]